MRIVFSDSAQKSLKKLSKKYKNIRTDLLFFISEIQDGKLGDKIQGLPLSVYKSRIRNSSVKKGKSAGFRIIYHIKFGELIYILSIYSKNDRGDISKKEIIRAIKDSNFYPDK